MEEKAGHDAPDPVVTGNDQIVQALPRDTSSLKAFSSYIFSWIASHGLPGIPG
jgi:hypothetical protein